MFFGVDQFSFVKLMKKIENYKFWTLKIIIKNDLKKTIVTITIM